MAILTWVFLSFFFLDKLPEIKVRYQLKFEVMTQSHRTGRTPQCEIHFMKDLLNNLSFSRS